MASHSGYAVYIAADQPATRTFGTRGRNTRRASSHKGALAPRAVDELVVATSWRVNAQTLISIRTPAVVTDLLNRMDGYYEESFERPLKTLISPANPSRKDR